MSELKASKKDLEGMRDLFGMAHDLISQAQFPGHVSQKVSQAMSFLSYQYSDFKMRAEVLERAEAAAPKAEEAVVAEPVAPPQA